VFGHEYFATFTEQHLQECAEFAGLALGALEERNCAVPKGDFWVLYGILVGKVVPVAASHVKHVTLPCCFALFPPCSLPGPSYFQSSRTTKVDLLTPKMDLPWTTTRTTLPRGHWLALLHRRS